MESGTGFCKIQNLLIWKVVAREEDNKHEFKVMFVSSDQILPPPPPFFFLPPLLRIATNRSVPLLGLQVLACLPMDSQVDSQVDCVFTATVV